MSVYRPACRLWCGVKVNDTCLELPLGNEIDSSLNIPVELPSEPVGVNVPADIILPLKSLDAFTVTLISMLLPFATVISSGAATANGTCFTASTLPSLFSVHSLNQT